MNNASLLLGKPIEALNGAIGAVDDLYLDDQTWTVRYLVVDTGKWLPGRTVPVAPEAIVKPWHHQAAIAVRLTREQIQSSPEIDTATPLSRAAEESLYRHYQWTPYWGAEPGDTAASTVSTRLRSANELAGYHVTATDGEVGRVDDLLLDDDLSRILFLVVEIKTWLFGKKILVPPSLTSTVDDAASTIHVTANCQGLKSAQEYKPAA